MKTGAVIQRLSVAHAQKNLEKAVLQIIQRAEWVNPYSVVGRQYRATLRELKQPLVELHVARREEVRQGRQP